MRKRQGMALGVLVAILAACSAPSPTASSPRSRAPNQGLHLKPGASPTSIPDQGSEQLPLSPSPQPDSISTPPLADLRGRILLPDGQGAAGVAVRAMLITDKGSGLLGNNAAGLVGAGGGLIGNNAAGLVGAGGGLIGNNAAGYRLAGVHPMVRRLMQVGLEAQTDEQGRYHLDLPASGIYNIESASKDGQLKAIAQGVNQAQGPVSLNLATPGKLSLRVQAETAKISDYMGITVFIPGTNYSGFTGTSGQVNFDSLPPGRFTFIAMSQRLGQGILAGVELAPGATVSENRPLIIKRPPVKLTAIEPPVFMAGDKVTLRGEAFGMDQGSLVKVSLSGRNITNPIVESNQSISFIAPQNAESGGVVVDVDGFSSNEMLARVANDLEVLSPPEVEIGQKVKLLTAAVDGARERVATAPVSFRLLGGAAFADLDASSGQVTAKAEGELRVEVSLSSLKVVVPITVVGEGVLTGVPGVAHGLLSHLSGLAFDAGRQRLILANPNNFLSYSLGDGELTHLAGALLSDFFGSGQFVDGQGSAAALSEVSDLACASDGTVFWKDGGIILRKLSPSGLVTSVAGREEGEAFLEGRGAGASLGTADAGMTLLSDASALFTTDNGFFLRVDPQGQVSAFETTPALPENSNAYVGASAPDGSAWFFFQDELVRVTANGNLQHMADATTPAWDTFFQSEARALCFAPNGAAWALNNQACLMHRPAGAQAWQKVFVASQGRGQKDGPLGENKAGRLGYVSAMVADGEGRLWLLCDGKLCRISSPLNNPIVTTELRGGTPLLLTRAKKKVEEAEF